MTMNYPLLVPRILEHATKLYPNQQIVTREGDSTHRYTYADMSKRVARLSNALSELGVGIGDRVATFGWNTYRHMEAYFAAPAMGAVLHTVNIRLAQEDLIYIINHAGDKVMLIDPDLVPLIEPIASELKTIEHFIVMSDDSNFESSLTTLCYEDLLSAASDMYKPVEIDEYSPMGICYTSATTGRPKGVVYTHRGVYLHTMGECMAGSMAFTDRDTVMAIVPMFHANCWGLPFASVMSGAAQVLPGVRPDPGIICNLIEQEKVTYSAGVPTIWIGVLDFLDRSEKEYDLSSLREIVSGGSALPESLIRTYEEKLGIRLAQAYGMTEATPLISYNRLRADLNDLDDDEKVKVAASQGLLVPGLEMKLVNDDGEELPWDGEQRGEILLRGPWIASGYYNDERSAETFVDGWYHSGDIASINAKGYIQIADRVKDLVKSGGEWISSVDLESAIMAHPDVLEAAVIAIPHPQYMERPLACVVPTEQSQGSLDKAGVMGFIEGKFARWWMPDDVVFINEMPKTSVGKFDKKVLREQFKDYSPAK